MDEAYDSTLETKRHAWRVHQLLVDVHVELTKRGICHDNSKLQPLEKTLFDEYTPKLKGTTYGSERYKQYLKELDVALKHHYENNKHHPEHYTDGINGMSLVDIIEMICDWRAATERHADGNILKSIEINSERFKISPQLKEILLNTVKYMRW